MFKYASFNEAKKDLRNFTSSNPLAKNWLFDGVQSFHEANECGGYLIRRITPNQEIQMTIVLIVKSGNDWISWCPRDAEFKLMEKALEEYLKVTWFNTSDNPYLHPSPMGIP